MQERECSVPCVQESSLVEKKMNASEWTTCMGLPCQMGKQTRTHRCSPSSVCDKELIEERNCLTPCSTTSTTQTLFESDGIYSNWTNWSACRSSDCTSIRTRQCVRGPCHDYLIDSRPCQSDFCSSNYHELRIGRFNRFACLLSL